MTVFRPIRLPGCPELAPARLAVVAWLTVRALLATGVADSPVLSLPDLSGERQSTSDFVGRLLVLNFWATWCDPCREEMPMLERLQQDYGRHGVVIVGASADDRTTRDRVRPFLDEAGISFPIWTGATVQDMDRFGLSPSLPSTLILDRDGRVAFRLIGPLKRRQLVRRLDFLLSGSRGRVPASMVSSLPAPAGDHEAGAHEHEDEEAHAHGGVGLEGASLVPS